MKVNFSFFPARDRRPGNRNPVQHNFPRIDDVFCLRQLGWSPSDDRSEPFLSCRRLCSGLRLKRDRPQGPGSVQRNLRARSRRLLRRNWDSCKCARPDIGKPARRNRFCTPRGACDRGRMRRPGIFHLRIAALSRRWSQRANRFRESGKSNGAFHVGFRPCRPAYGRDDHAGDGSRHRLFTRPH